MAAFTPSATFCTMAGRPMSSGLSSALIAVPMARRDFDTGPVAPVRAKMVACGVITPSQPPDQTIGICATSVSERCPCFISARRNAWSARMRVKRRRASTLKAALWPRSALPGLRPWRAHHGACGGLLPLRPVQGRLHGAHRARSSSAATSRCTNGCTRCTCWSRPARASPRMQLAKEIGITQKSAWFVLAAAPRSLRRRH